jgi:glyoxylase I family protein
MRDGDLRGSCVSRPSSSRHTCAVTSGACSITRASRWVRTIERSAAGQHTIMTADLPTERHDPSDRSAQTEGVVVPRGFANVRLTVTDIHRSKDFYRHLLGREPGTDFQRPGRRAQRTPVPDRVYGGCSFTLEGQTLGLRPVAAPDDTFDANRAGLDHLSLLASSVEELHRAAERLEGAASPGDLDLLVCPVSIVSRTPDDAASPLISVLAASERGRSRCGACSATRRGEATGVGSPGCVPRRSNRSAPSARPSGHILHPRVLEPSITQSTPACSSPRTGRPSVMGGADTGSAIVRHVPIQADVSARGMAIVLLPRCRAAARRGADPRVGSRELRLARRAQQRRN